MIREYPALNIKFVCYTDWHQLPDSANALFERAAKDSLFFSRQWLARVTTESANDGETLLLACVVSAGTVMAILPLMQSPIKTWYSVKHGYTALFSLLLASDDQQNVLACLAQGLSQLPFTGVLLEPVAKDDNNMIAFQHAMESAGFRCDHTFRHYNWIYRVQGESFADYMVARPARVRNTIARKQRKLEREHGYEIRLYTGDETLPAMTDYYAIYCASWKANEQNEAFLKDIVESFSKAGWTRLAILYVKGKPVAAQLWFVHHGKANVFRLAYDDTWRHYSPGSILTRFLMQHVIDTDKVEEIDYLTGNDFYKQDWMSERRERYVLCCIKNTKPANKYERLFRPLKRLLPRHAGSKARAGVSNG